MTPCTTLRWEEAGPWRTPRGFIAKKRANAPRAISSGQVWSARPRTSAAGVRPRRELIRPRLVRRAPRRRSIARRQHGSRPPASARTANDGCRSGDQLRSARKTRFRMRQPDLAVMALDRDRFDRDKTPASAASCHARRKAPRNPDAWPGRTARVATTAQRSLASRAQAAP